MAAEAAGAGADAGGGTSGDAPTGPAVVVVGSSNVDMIAYVETLPRGGETVKGRDFTQCFGGKGANQAVQAAKLGAHTAMVTRVGDDDFAGATIKNFADCGIATDHVLRTANTPSGLALITVEAAGENTIVVVGGSNDKLTASDVHDARDVFADARVVLTQMEVPTEASLAALQCGKEAGAMTLFNPAPARTDVDPATYDELFRAADIVCPNETEAELLCRGGAEAAEPGDDGMGVYAASARELIRRGATSVLMTLGKQGCLWVSGADGGSRYVHIPGHVVPADEVKDTTGAGDSFLGSLAAYVCEGHDVPEAARLAGISAAKSVTRAGTQPSYATAAELAADA